MEPIRFSLGEYYDILDEQEDVFDEYKDFLDTEEEDGESFVVTNYRIVIPNLRICLREADHYTLDPDMDPGDEGAWEIRSSGYLLYTAEERDINAWEDYCDEELAGAVRGVCRAAGISPDAAEDLACYIEFDE